MKGLILLEKNFLLLVSYVVPVIISFRVGSFTLIVFLKNPFNCNNKNCLLKMNVSGPTCRYYPCRKKATVSFTVNLRNNQDRIVSSDTHKNRGCILCTKAALDGIREIEYWNRNFDFRADGSTVLRCPCCNAECSSTDYHRQINL